MKANFGLSLSLGVLLASCGKSGPTADGVANVPASPPPVAPAPASAAPAAPLPSTACSHAACGDDYFIDASPPDGCSSGAPCRITMKLVATGDFHVNAEYPYRFKGDANPAVEFLGSDPAGKNVFSKAAGDWAQSDAKSGIMAVQVRPTSKGAATVSGVFKLSVCSAQNCLIEQPTMRVAIAAR